MKPTKEFMEKKENNISIKECFYFHEAMFHYKVEEGKHLEKSIDEHLESLKGVIKKKLKMRNIWQ